MAIRAAFVMLATVAVVGCGDGRGGAGTPRVESIPHPPTPKDLRIVVQRTACLGTCPVSTTTLDAEGVVTFSGLKHVVVGGEHSWRVSPEVIQGVWECVNASRFFAVGEDLDDKVRDQYSVIVTVSYGGQVRRVESRWSRLAGFDLATATPRRVDQHDIDALALILEQRAGTRVLIAP